MPPVVALLVSGSLLVTGVAAAETLGEARVIELAASRDSRVHVAERAVDVAAARQVGATLYPNPNLSWQRQELPSGDSFAETEDSIWLTVPIDISGNRAARGALARAGVATARATHARTRSDVVVQALELFYRIVELEQRVAVTRVLLGRIDAAARVLERRRTQGTASGYEQHRLLLERDMTQSRARELEGRSAALKAQLGAVLRTNAPATPRGDLAVAPAPPSDPASGDRRSLKLARRALTEARQARADASLAWLPALSLMGGFRVRDSVTTQYGYIAGVSLPLPVFSRGQDVERTASAQQALAEARVRSAETQANVELTRAGALFEMAQGELARFEADTADRVQRLQRAASSGYEEGRRTILELLDVQRAAADVEQRRIDLAAAARRAHIALRAAKGEFE